MKEQFIVVRENRAAGSDQNDFRIAQIEALQRELAKSQARVLELEDELSRLTVVES